MTCPVACEITMRQAQIRSDYRYRGRAKPLAYCADRISLSAVLRKNSAIGARQDITGVEISAVA